MRHLQAYSSHTKLEIEVQVLLNPVTIFTHFWPNGEFSISFCDPLRAAESLGLSVAGNPHKPSDGSPEPPSGWTQEKFSSKAKRLVRNACHILGDKKYLSFLTLTLPELLDYEEAMLDALNPELMRVFNQRLKRTLVARGLTGEIVAVREFQKRGALHWHLVFVGRHRGCTWALRPTEITAMWSQVICNLLGREINCKAATKIERVRKDAGRYLSKYMSKNQPTANSTAEVGHENRCTRTVAGRSWSITHSLRRKIVVVSDDRLGFFLWKNRHNAPLSWVYEIVVNDVCVGIVGCLRRHLEDLRRYAESTAYY